MEKKKDVVFWLTGELKQKVRKVFEPKYRRKLTDDELMTISENLVQWMEVSTKLRWSKNYGEEIKNV